MKPGRDLDALVAEKVMGEKWCQLMPEGYADKFTGPRKCKCGAIGFPYEHHKPFSTDIAAAFEVEQELKKRNIRFEINPTVEGYQVSCIRHTPEEDDEFHCVWTGIGNSVTWSDSLPHAMCLSALAAVGHGVEEKE